MDPLRLLIRKDWWKGLLLGGLALALFTIRLAAYPDYVYDEKLYVPSARTFLQGTADTNPEHPPLGKLLIAGGIKAFGDSAFGWRFPSVVAGSLTVAEIFFVALMLLESSKLAMLAGILALLNNFTFVMARVAMLEAFIMMFGVAGVAAWVAAAKGIHPRWMLAASGVLLGCAVAVKWTALAIWGVVAIATVVFWVQRRWGTGAIYAICCLAVLPAAAYCLSYWPLLRSQHIAFSLGEVARRAAFIVEFHRHANGTPTANSPWYRWIFRTEPNRGLNFMVGNWAVCWTGLAAVVVCAYRFVKQPALAEGLSVALFGATWLQWAVIHRPFYYYYYFSIAATFLCLALPTALRRAPDFRILGVRVALVSTIAATLIFLVFYPAMTGLGPPWDCAIVCIGSAVLL